MLFYVVAVTHWLEPIRPNAFAQLGSEPRFLLETILGAVAIIATALAAFRAAIPGALTRLFAVSAIVLMVVGSLLTRRLYPLQAVPTGLACGLAAGMLPALYMQIACMYVPEHIMKFHILPGLLMMVLGGGIAWFFRPARDGV
ncbi:MAG: hypothetical protein ACI9JM_000374 [Halioglobus sp.]